MNCAMQLVMSSEVATYAELLYIHVNEISGFCPNKYCQLERAAEPVKAGKYHNNNDARM